MMKKKKTEKCVMDLGRRCHGLKVKDCIRCRFYKPESKYRIEFKKGYVERR